MKIILGIVAGLVVLMVLFAIFPIILSGVDIVNQTTNMTEYLGLAEINNIAPLIIFICLILIVIGLVVWQVFGKRIGLH